MDPYLISDTTRKEPPRTFLQRLSFLGPGFILSASIVGSGELIATTTLGARAGFAAFWIIVVSCLCKVAVQLEFGKHTILTGQTAIQAFAQLPGPRIGKGNWSVWIVLLVLILKLAQIGGILGGTALILTMLFPGIPLTAWSLLAAVVTSALIFKGYYKPVEKISLFMITMFTALTISSLIFLQTTPYRFSAADVFTQLQFHFTPAVTAVAIGAFGITGVASDEIIAYTYWCIEKGYAAYTGPYSDGPAWKTRAQGWINVMYIDARLAMVLYTAVTAAFYLLGAAVLHARGEIPEESKLIETLAGIYTQSLGPGSRTAFLIGGFFVLYSSLFASLAAWTRVFPDIFGQLKWINFGDRHQRARVVAVLSWVFPMLWASAFLFIHSPLLMILSGGIFGSFLLFIVAFGAWHFRYRGIQLATPGILYDIALWVSLLTILGVGLYGFAGVFYR